MKITYTPIGKINNPTLSDVAENQLFINEYESLCQKYSSSVYHIISKVDGRLLSDTIQCNPNVPIKAIIPIGTFKVLMDVAGIAPSYEETQQ